MRALLVRGFLMMLSAQCRPGTPVSSIKYSFRAVSPRIASTPNIMRSRFLEAIAGNLTTSNPSPARENNCPCFSRDRIGNLL